jgi:hypothetical protein
MMNDILRDMLDAGTVVYIDDILIYSETEEQHVELVREVLSRLEKHSLAIEPEKCFWHQEKVDFLGYVVSAKGIEMATDKVETILKWREPQNVTEVQSFLGFANFYRRFIQDYSKVAKPLTDLTSKSLEWNWTRECKMAFKLLKRRFTSAPILVHYDPDLPIVVECDASDFAIGAILSQKVNDKWHPVAFYSRKMNKAEINYEIHDKELLAVTAAFKEWRRYLEGAKHQITVYTDHRGLEWFANNRPINRRQARWALELDGYDFVIVYRPGVRNGKPDALSRRSEYRPEKGGQDYQPVQRVFKKGQWASEATVEQSRWKPAGEPEVLVSSVQLTGLRPVVKLADGLVKEIIELAAKDPTWQEQYHGARENGAVNGESIANVTFDHGMLFRNGKVWVPNDINLKKKILDAEHDSEVAGHMGMDKAES